MGKPSVLGIDIGGSHITAALVNLETRSIVRNSYKRKFVNSQDSAERIVTSWCEIIEESFNSTDVLSKKIGIAMPGPFDYENGISLMCDQDKFNDLYKLNIKEELAKRLNIPVKDIRFINDAVGFLQGEVFGGAARKYSKVLGLTLGTGLGSAIHREGITEDADLWDSKFKEGIAEDYLSGRWFSMRYNELTGETIKGVKELIQLQGSESYKERIFLEYAHNLASFIVPLIHKYDLEAVVIGGNISNAFELFLPELSRILKENGTETAIEIAHLKEDASLMGAASCWEDSYKRTTLNKF